MREFGVSACGKCDTLAAKVVKWKMSFERSTTPLIFTQKPSKASLIHQSSVDSSDLEQSEREDSPQPSSPAFATVPPPSLAPPPPSSGEKEKKKKKRGSFLFRRRRKKGSRDSLEPTDGAKSEDLTEFADVLMDPSLVHGQTRAASASSDQLLSLPAPIFLSRSVSDSQVHKAGVGSEFEGDSQSYLVQITLESGHGLAVRDRTGTSDPYVKFKFGQFKYRSTVVNRNLNPEWNESFSFVTNQLHLPLDIKVYDHDFGSNDDYMGGGSVVLSGHTHDQVNIVNVGLRDPNAKETSLGYIRLFVFISEHSEEHSVETAVQHSIQEWNNILTIHLLKGSNLPSRDDNGFSDPYCKLKLGRQKRRSKMVSRCLAPNWKEQFDLRMYRGDSTTLHIEVWDWNLLQPDDFIGETCVELDTLTKEQTHDLTLPLTGHYQDDDCGTIHLLLTITGTTVHEVVEGSGSANSSRTAVQAVENEMKDLMKKYLLTRSLNLSQLSDIGHVTVIIDHVEGLTKPANVFAIAEVGNSQARTHTVSKTTSPSWGKAFHFDLKDIHSVLEVAVYADKDKPELVGKVKIPLLRLEAGINKGYVLKDKRCLEAAQGVLYLRCELVYQPVRAAIRTLRPRESKLMEREAPFKRKVLMQNIRRITALVNSLSSAIEIVRHIYNWENNMHSTLALLGFVVGCLLAELWMAPVLMVVGLLALYGRVYMRGRHQWQQLARRQGSTTSSDSIDRPPLQVAEDEWSDLDDDLEEVVATGGRGAKGGRNLRKKFRQIQGVLLIVQNALGEIADTGERVNNLLAWRVPFLCWLSIAILSILTIITFLIPLRYLILIWGVNKLTKKLRKPNHIPNNELLDLISCSPTNFDLQQFRELSLRRGSSAVPSRGKPRSRSHSNALLKKGS